MERQHVSPVRRRLITVEDLATKTSLAKSTIYAMAKAGRLPGFVGLSGRVRFDEEIVDAWINRGGGHA